MSLLTLYLKWSLHVIIPGKLNITIIEEKLLDVFWSIGEYTGECVTKFVLWRCAVNKYRMPPHFPFFPEYFEVHFCEFFR